MARLLTKNGKFVVRQDPVTGKKTVVAVSGPIYEMLETLQTTLTSMQDRITALEAKVEALESNNN